MFGTRKSPGYPVGNNTLRCIAPVHSPGSVLVSVELLSGMVLKPAEQPVWFDFVTGSASSNNSRENSAASLNGARSSSVPPGRIQQFGIHNFLQKNVQKK